MATQTQQPQQSNTQMTLEEYKKELEKIAKGHKGLEETLRLRTNKDWQEFLLSGFDPSTALYSAHQGLI